MMTPQEVATSTFPKATLGGYNMAAVDVFLDRLTEDYDNLYKENAALKVKLKEKSDKVEEYRSMEDTLRSTLVTAQKVALNMKSEAEEKCAELIANAEADARVRMRELAADIAAEERRLVAVHEEIDRQIALEHERLAAAQRELAAFINGAKALCNRQLALIDRLNEMEILPAGFSAPQNSEPEEHHAEPAAPHQEAQAVPEERSAAPADEETAAAQPAAENPNSDVIALVESMRSVIDSFTNESDIKVTEDAEVPFEIGFDDADKLFDENANKSVEDPFENTDEDNYDNFGDEEQGATRVLNLNDLQFGRNYNKD